MIDIHSHILPNVDDGSQSVEESRKILEMLQDQGVETVVATPHFYPRRDRVEAFLERRAKAAAQLDAPVILGAEIAYFPGIGNSKELGGLTLGNSRLLLVEMPYGSWTEQMVLELCDMATQTGLSPVLAHVDRYPRQIRRWSKALLASGVYFQCNAESLLRWKSRGFVLRQLKQGNIHFLGSDSHNLTNRKPCMAEAAAVITKKLGSEALKNLTAFTKSALENPAR